MVARVMLQSSCVGQDQTSLNSAVETSNISDSLSVVEKSIIKKASRGWKKGLMRGKGGPQNATCEFRGVRQRTWGKWVAEIREPKKRSRLWLGSFASAEDAARAYDEAARKLYGAHAHINLPQESPSTPPIDESRANSCEPYEPKTLFSRSQNVARRAHRFLSVSSAPREMQDDDPSAAAAASVQASLVSGVDRSHSTEFTAENRLQKSELKQLPSSLKLENAAADQTSYTVDSSSTAQNFSTSFDGISISDSIALNKVSSSSSFHRLPSSISAEDQYTTNTTDMQSYNFSAPDNLHILPHDELPRQNVYTNIASNFEAAVAAASGDLRLFLEELDALELAAAQYEDDSDSSSDTNRGFDSPQMTTMMNLMDHHLQGPAAAAAADVPFSVSNWDTMELDSFQEYPNFDSTPGQHAFLGLDADQNISIWEYDITSPQLEVTFMQS